MLDILVEKIYSIIKNYKFIFKIYILKQNKKKKISHVENDFFDFFRIFLK